MTSLTERRQYDTTLSAGQGSPNSKETGSREAGDGGDIPMEVKAPRREAHLSRGQQRRSSPAAFAAALRVPARDQARASEKAPLRKVAGPRRHGQRPQANPLPARALRAESVKPRDLRSRETMRVRSSQGFPHSTSGPLRVIQKTQ